MRSRMLAALTAGLLLASSGSARAQEEVRALVARAIKAHGGEGPLAKFTAEQVKARGTIDLDGKKITFTAETTVQLPGQFKNVMQYELDGKKGTLIQVLDGDKGWLSINGATEALDDKKLAETRETMYVQRLIHLLVLLKDDLQLTALPETKVNDKPALGMKVASKGHSDVNLYFDKASGLLVKTERRAFNSNAKKEVLQEDFFSDYKEINGIKRPMKAVLFHDGKKFMEGEVTEVKQADKLPAGTFAKP